VAVRRGFRAARRRRVVVWVRGLDIFVLWWNEVCVCGMEFVYMGVGTSSCR